MIQKCTFDGNTKSAGDIYKDTSENRHYVGWDTSRNKDDLLKMAVFYSGTTTVTADAGDITVTLPFDWSNGYLKIIFTTNSAEWVDDGAAYWAWETSYDALTNAGYSGDHEIYRYGQGAGFQSGSSDKSANTAALLKSATTTSFTINDSATVYVKYFVWA